jgi:probable HAF family extracellular repeat protein
MTSIKTLGFAAVFATGMATTAYAGGYQFIPIIIPPPVGNLVYDPPYPDNAQALSINDNGQVLVSAVDVSGSEPFADNADFNDIYNIHTHTFTALPAVPGAVANSTLANGINDSGQIVGQYDPGNGGSSAFLYTGGVYTTINPFHDSDPNIFALAISNNGLITGADDNIDSMGDALSSQGFVGSGGLYTSFQFGSVPGTFTVGRGVNDSGTVVGHYSLPSGVHGMFLDQGGVITDITAPGAVEEVPGQMNDAGVIVGGVVFDPTYSSEDGFIYKNGVTTLLDFPGSAYTFIEGINNQGDIVGTYSAAADIGGAFLAVPLPEPATWALMLVGLGGLGAAIRGRRGLAGRPVQALTGAV